MHENNITIQKSLKQMSFNNWLNDRKKEICLISIKLFHNAIDTIISFVLFLFWGVIMWHVPFLLQAVVNSKMLHCDTDGLHCIKALLLLCVKVLLLLCISSWHFFTDTFHFCYRQVVNSKRLHYDTEVPHCIKALLLLCVNVLLLLCISSSETVTLTHTWQSSTHWILACAVMMTTAL